VLLLEAMPTSLRRNRAHSAVVLAARNRKTLWAGLIGFGLGVLFSAGMVLLARGRTPKTYEECVYGAKTNPNATILCDRIFESRTEMRRIAKCVRHAQVEGSLATVSITLVAGAKPPKKQWAQTISETYREKIKPSEECKYILP